MLKKRQQQMGGVFMRRMDGVSLTAFLAGLLAVGSYCYMYIYPGLIPVMFLSGTLSLTLALIAPIHRIRRGNKGNGMEVAAIVMGGLTFYLVVLLGTALPWLTRFFGWIIFGILHNRIKASMEKQQKASAEDPEQKTAKKSPTALLTAALIASLAVIVLLCMALSASEWRQGSISDAARLRIIAELQKQEYIPEPEPEPEPIPEPAPAPEAKPEEAADPAVMAEAVLFLEMYDRWNTCIGTASGFLVQDQKTLVTNYHVVEEASSIVAWTTDGDCTEANLLLAYDEVADLAILSCEEELSVETLELLDSDTVRQGMAVYAIGYPLGVANTVSNGIISARYEDEYGVDTLQTTAAISHGNSGGPLLTENGQVIGVIRAYYIDGQNMNLATSSNTLQSLLDAKTEGIALREWRNRPSMPD